MHVHLLFRASSTTRDDGFAPVITTASWGAIERTVSLNEYPSTKHNNGPRYTYQRDFAIEEMGGNPSIFSASRKGFSMRKPLKMA